MARCAGSWPTGTSACFGSLEREHDRGPAGDRRAGALRDRIGRRPTSASCSPRRAIAFVALVCRRRVGRPAAAAPDHGGVRPRPRRAARAAGGPDPHRRRPIWQIVVIEALYGAAQAFFRPATPGSSRRRCRRTCSRRPTRSTCSSTTSAGFVGPALAAALVTGRRRLRVRDRRRDVPGLRRAAAARAAARARRAGRAQPVTRGAAEGWREVRSRPWADW